MSHRRKRRKSSGGVQMNLAAMLDMAFQLLAFFILTFKPAPIEGHLQVHMPPPVPTTNVEQDPSESTGEGSQMTPGLETLDLFITADERGDVFEIKVGQRPVIRSRLHAVAMQRLDDHLQSIFKVQAIPFDRIQLRVDGRLRYEELMKIVDVCTRQILPDGKPLHRVSFTELGGPAGAAP